METVTPTKETFVTSHLPGSNKRTMLPQYCKNGFQHDTDEPNAKRIMLSSHSRSRDETCDSTYDNLVTVAMCLEKAGEKESLMLQKLLVSNQEVSPGFNATEFLKFVFSMRRKALLAEITPTKNNKKSITEQDKKKQDELTWDDVDGYPTNSCTNRLKIMISEKAQVFAKENAIKLKNYIMKLLKSTNKEADDEIDGFFDKLERYGTSGKLVMNAVGESGELVPEGSYCLDALARCFKIDALVHPPEHVTVTVTWDRQTRCVVFPKEFCSTIPKVIATTENLKYYDCQMACQNFTLVQMLFPSEIQTFNYTEDYLAEHVEPQEKDGGASLERHPFAHLDSPLCTDSGVLVLGKFTNSSETQLHLTAFYVPQGQTVYIPGNVIHTNNYFRGKWKTLLAGEVDIDLAHLVKGNKNGEHFSFTFSNLNI